MIRRNGPWIGLFIGLAMCLLAVASHAQSGPQDWIATTAYSRLVPVAGVPASPVPASLAGSAHWTSGCIASAAARAFDVYAELAGTSTLQIQRYADAACAYPVAAAVPSTALALTSGGSCPGATYCGDVGSNDGTPFLAIKITVTDTSGSTNAITTVALAQGAE